MRCSNVETKKSLVASKAASVKGKKGAPKKKAAPKRKAKK